MRDESNPTNPTTNRHSEDWIPEAAFEALRLERHVNGDPQPEDSNPIIEERLTRTVLRKSAAMAAQSIVHIALHGVNERTRLDASKYVVERLLGPVGQDAGGTEDPLHKLLEALNGDATSQDNPR